MDLKQLTEYWKEYKADIKARNTSCIEAYQCDIEKYNNAEPTNINIMRDIRIVDGAPIPLPILSELEKATTEGLMDWLYLKLHKEE